jgi:CHASE2 domain-containing sensor protein
VNAGGRRRIKWDAVVPYACLLAILLTTQWLEYTGWFSAPSGRFADVILSGSSKSSEAVARPVVTIEIDDDAYENWFKGTSPMDANLVGQLVALVASAKPPVIGVDILTDAKKYCEQYRAIAKRLSHSDSAIVWAAAVRDVRVEPPKNFLSWLRGRKDEIVADPSVVLGYEANDRDPDRPFWGLPLFPRDDDAVIRRLPLAVTISANVEEPKPDSPKVDHWTKAIASAYCRWSERVNHYTCPVSGAEEVLVPYGGTAPYRFSASQFFVNNSGELNFAPGFEKLLTDTVRNRAVLIGGTFRNSGDFHESPIGRIPGLLINAYAVEAQVKGGEFFEIEQPQGWIFDLLLGLAIIFAFSERGIEWARRKFQNWKLASKWLKNYEHHILLSGGFVFGILCLIFFAVGLFSRHYLLGLVPMGIGMFLEQFIHIHIHAHQAITHSASHAETH